jgi:Spy/CpxP family protein refolding chaperone
MRRSSPWVAVLVAAATFIATTAVATTAVQAGGPEKGAIDHRSQERRLQRELGLTDQQVQAIRQIHQREAEARKQHGQALQQAQTELRRLILTEADNAAIEAKRAEVERLLTEGLHRRMNTLREITPLLTPEQREKYAQLAGKAWRHRGHHRDRS